MFGKANKSGKEFFWRVEEGCFKPFVSRALKVILRARWARNSFSFTRQYLIKLSLKHLFWRAWHKNSSLQLSRTWKKTFWSQAEHTEQFHCWQLFIWNSCIFHQIALKPFLKRKIYLGNNMGWWFFFLISGLSLAVIVLLRLVTGLIVYIILGAVALGCIASTILMW